MTSINEFEGSPSDITKITPIDLTLTDEELGNRFMGMRTSELKARKMIVEQVATEAHNKHDPRWERVSDQGRLLDKEIVRRAKKIREENGIPEPLAQIVEMQPARTKVKRHALKRIVAGTIPVGFHKQGGPQGGPIFTAGELGLLKIST